MGNNWARWGTDDERGALNLVDETARRRGLDAVSQALPISLGLPVETGASPRALIRPDVQHLMLRDGGDYAAGLPERPGYGFADDLLILACHGTTHLDALSHVWQDGLMWNGFPSSEVTSRGARRSGVETVGSILTRGIFLDLAADRAPDDGQPIEAAELDAALDRAGVLPQAGDALLVRTGWLARWRTGHASETSWPGLGLSCVELVERHQFALVGADNIAVEVEPSTDPTCAMPLHVSLMRDRGVFFLELLDLEELASHKASTFLLVVAPLRIVGGSGSPVAPLAVL
jgi:kynurenine formamidase